MRSLYRTLGAGLARDIALVCLADAVVAVSFGAVAVGAGLPAWLPILLSLAVFAGASQFLLVGIVAAGGGLVAAVAAGLLVNARHLPFGFAVADTLGGGPARRLAGTHLMVDESVAFALAQPEPRRRAVAYWACGIGLFVSFNLATAAGVLAGRALGDPDAWGLDAAFPAVLLALVLPALRERGTRRAALLGAAIALAASTVLPPGLPVLLSLLALPATALVARRPGGHRMSAASGSGPLLAVGLLALGTYGYRAVGPLLRDRVRLPARVRRWAGTATVVLLTAVAATAALLPAGTPAGIARPAGVLVAGVLAWRRAPFLLVVVAAAGTAALLRLAGVG